MWTVRRLISAPTTLSRMLFPGTALSFRVRPSASGCGPQPWRIQLSGGSLAFSSAGGSCWQSHQVPPGQSS